MTRYTQWMPATGSSCGASKRRSAGPDQDVGSAPTIGGPGGNGFPHGAVYVAGTNNIQDAIDLLTGREIWEFNLQQHSAGVNAGTQSAAALVGRRAIVAYAALRVLTRCPHRRPYFGGPARARSVLHLTLGVGRAR